MAGSTDLRSVSSRGRGLARSFREVWVSADDVFSRSVRGDEEDDEHVLTWAALEQLPTYDRMRRGNSSD
ncbi:unnamed protein product [Victoria cruziana]